MITNNGLYEQLIKTIKEGDWNWIPDWEEEPERIYIHSHKSCSLYQYLLKELQLEENNRIDLEYWYGGLYICLGYLGIDINKLRNIDEECKAHIGNPIALRGHRLSINFNLPHQEEIEKLLKTESTTPKTYVYSTPDTFSSMFAPCFCSNGNMKLKRVEKYEYDAESDELTLYFTENQRRDYTTHTYDIPKTRRDDSDEEDWIRLVAVSHLDEKTVLEKAVISNFNKHCQLNLPNSLDDVVLVYQIALSVIGFDLHPLDSDNILSENRKYFYLLY